MMRAPSLDVRRQTCKVIVRLFCDICVCRNTTAHAHSRAQRGCASSAAVQLRLHSSTGLRPAATAQLRLRHVIDPHPPHPDPAPSSHPIVLLLTSFLWSSTHNRGHKQATAHSGFHCYFLFCCAVTRGKRRCRDSHFFCLKINLNISLFLFHIPYL